MRKTLLLGGCFAAFGLVLVFGGSSKIADDLRPSMAEEIGQARVAREQAAPPQRMTQSANLPSLPAASTTGGVVWATSSTATSNTLALITTNAVGYIICDSRGICQATSAPPAFSMSCTEDACEVNAYGSGTGSAKAMLEKIANRSMRIEVVTHGQACQVQRETIQPKPKEDLVAQAQ